MILNKGWSFARGSPAWAYEGNVSEKAVFIKHRGVPLQGNIEGNILGKAVFIKEGVVFW